MTDDMVRGADIGWLSQLEAKGVIWVNDEGVQEDALQILKNHGINAIRLRVFVNPPSNYERGKTFLGYADTAGVVNMAKRVRQMDMNLLIDFHYSDHWADPGKQDKPAAWRNHAVSQLKTDVYNHTYEVLRTLAEEGLIPKWVQVGNEISHGMMWPEGSTDHADNLAQFLDAGYAAVKAASPSSQVIVHLDNGSNAELYRRFFDALKAEGARFDIIGMSYYPFWNRVNYKQDIDALGENLKDMATRYGKEVMICEVGGLENEPEETYAMLRAVLDQVKAVPDGKGLGLFYWEPEANSNVLPDGYKLGATSVVSPKVLKFTQAMRAFIED